MRAGLIKPGHILIAAEKNTPQNQTQHALGVQASISQRQG
jgi:hypothetical protein